jgi:succinate dehydrogenase (ubiquinone) membrane anchor subunit
MRQQIARNALFSTSATRKIMPPGPQVIEGGVNEPAPVPHPSPIHGSYHWSFERLVSIGLVPLTLAPFAAGSISPAVDASLVFLLIIHSHMGFQ